MQVLDFPKCSGQMAGRRPKTGLHPRLAVTCHADTRRGLDSLPIGYYTAFVVWRDNNKSRDIQSHVD